MNERESPKKKSPLNPPLLRGANEEDSRLPRGAGNNIQTLQVMRYMGNKQKLLPQIVSEVGRLAKPGSIVVDLMAGTHSVGYALKDTYRVFANDVQAYTVPIGNALLRSDGLRLDSKNAADELEQAYRENLSTKTFDFFASEYADTYFSPEQCAQIDSIRYAIEQRKDDDAYYMYMTALIYAACLTQSTPGHFAQFMPSDHPRVQPLREMCIWQEFLKKIDEMEIHPGCQDNYVFAGTWQDFFALQEVKSESSDFGVIYVDPPYSQEQYSRFYHLLETLVLYDEPETAHKARYRADRYKSNFCYRNRVEKEFDDLFGTIKECCECPVLVSYGSKGLLPKDDLLSLCMKYFDEVTLKEIPYPHSTLGKGTVPDNLEYLISCR